MPKYILVGLCLLLWLPATLAATMVSLEIEQDGDRYRMQAVMLLAADPAAVMHVLLNFRDLPRLNPSIKSVRVLARVPPLARVSTRAELCFFVFVCQTLHRVEIVHKVSATELRSRVIPAFSDLKFGRSRWLLTRVPQGAMLVFATEIEPGSWVPPVVGSMLVRNTMEEQIRVTSQNLEKLAREYTQRLPADQAGP